MSFMKRAAKPLLICMALVAHSLLITAAQATGYTTPVSLASPLATIAGSFNAVVKVGRSLTFPTCLSAIHC